MFSILLPLVMLTISASPAASAHDARIGAIRVVHPAAPATLPGQSSGAVYLSIENQGTTADALLSLASPAATGVAIHSMTMDGAVMKMREVDSLPLAPSAKIVMKSGSGHHVMLTGLKQPLAVGDRIPLTLTFKRAGKLEVSVHVEQSAAQKAAGHAAHQH